MGVGKTAVGQKLKRRLNKCVFLDGDWCWDMNPFQITEETKQMVMNNICFLLNSFIKCSAYENIAQPKCLIDQLRNPIRNSFKVKKDGNPSSFHCSIPSFQLLWKFLLDLGHRKPASGSESGRVNMVGWLSTKYPYFCRYFCSQTRSICS